MSKQLPLPLPPLLPLCLAHLFHPLEACSPTLAASEVLELQPPPPLPGCSALHLLPLLLLLLLGHCLSKQLLLPLPPLLPLWLAHLLHPLETCSPTLAASEVLELQPPPPLP